MQMKDKNEKEIRKKGMEVMQFERRNSLLKDKEKNGNNKMVKCKKSKA